MAEKDDEKKRVRRASRKDIKLLRSLTRRMDRKRREYQVWQEKQLDELVEAGRDVHRQWVVSWRDGHVIDRDDPANPKTLERLPHDVCVKARKREDEIFALDEKLVDFMERLGDLHRCPANAIVTSPRDANGRPTGKMVGEIDYEPAVDEEKSLPEDEVAELGLNESAALPAPGEAE
jgi:hypothetical protein